MSKNAQPLALKRILIPIDFSRACAEAIPWAKFLARTAGSEIHLVHVHGFEYPLPIGIIPPSMRSRNEIEKRVLVYLKRFAVKYRLAGAGVKAHVRTGNAPDQICALAREIDADLIVSSTHGHTGWRHALLGSTAERLVRHAPCPVLIARHPSTGRAQAPSVEKIVVPFDFSNASSKGVEFAIKFGRSFDAALTLLNVVTPDRFVVPQGALVYATPELKERAVADARRRLSAFTQKIYFDDVPFKTVVRAGSPAVEISKFAQRSASDLIIVATHGRSGLRHALLGSVTEHIVRYADGAVLVVPTRRGAKS